MSKFLGVWVKNILEFVLSMLTDDWEVVKIFTEQVLDDFVFGFH